VPDHFIIPNKKNPDWMHAEDDITPRLF